MARIPGVVDELISFEEDYTDPTEGTQLVIKRSQDIPDWHLDALKDERDNPQFDTFGNRMVRFASIPMSVVQKWDREGFPWEAIFHGPNGPSEIMKKLRQEELDAFITTRKTI